MWQLGKVSIPGVIVPVTKELTHGLRLDRKAIRLETSVTLPIVLSCQYLVCSHQGQINHSAGDAIGGRSLSGGAPCGGPL